MADVLLSTPLSAIINHMHTAHLFIRSDYMTILIPVTIFAAIAAPIAEFQSLLETIAWIGLHLLQADVNNQAFSGHEDRINKPWRPLPSGRINVRQACVLRWFLVVSCLFISSILGRRVVYASATLSFLLILYNDLDLSGHPAFKNICNAGGYVAFELGATLILSPTRTLDRTAIIALACSALVILTTIHAQDFRDIEGDKTLGRRTLPIVAPEGSRAFIVAGLFLWSCILAKLWGLGPLSAVIFIGLGSFVAGRYFHFREARDEKYSFTLYNIWFLTAILLPANARLPALIL